MALVTRAVTVGTTAVQLSTTNATGAPGHSVAFYNNSTVDVFFGGSNAVSTSNGAPASAGSWSPAVDLDPGESLWAIAGTAGNEVRVVESGL